MPDQYIRCDRDLNVLAYGEHARANKCGRLSLGAADWRLAIELQALSARGETRPEVALNRQGTQPFRSQVAKSFAPQQRGGLGSILSATLADPVGSATATAGRT